MVMAIMSSDLVSREPLNVDVSCVGNAHARSELREAFERLSRHTREIDHFWPKFSSGHSRELPWNTLVCGDLSHIVRTYHSTDRHQWIAQIRETRPYILAFIRTRMDEACAEWVGELVRTSDLRVSVCRFRQRSRKWLSSCLDEAAASLDPDSVLGIRYLRAERSLWVEFGDGLSGLVRPGELGFDDPEELRLDTAAVGPYPGTVQVLDRTGATVDIDSGSIRALLDARFASGIAADAETSTQQLGVRVRAQRLRLGITQAELARRSGLDQAIISKLERGKHQPRWDTLERYAGGLGLRPAALLEP